MNKPKKLVGMIQSNYIPWRGYFDFIDEVDVFIIYDDVQYTRKDWRNRNTINTANGPAWLTVPVTSSLTAPELIQDSLIVYSENWMRKHIGTVTSSYQKAPFFKPHAQGYFDILSAKHRTISELNVAIIRWAMEILGIKTPIGFSRDFDPQGDKTDRILDILNKMEATAYLVGPSAKNYIEVQKFKDAGIELEFKAYAYPEYPQIHGQFVGQVSVLDLIFNCGPDSRRYLKSTIANERAW